MATDTLATQFNRVGETVIARVYARDMFGRFDGQGVGGTSKPVRLGSVKEGDVVYEAGGPRIKSGPNRGPHHMKVTSIDTWDGGSAGPLTIIKGTSVQTGIPMKISGSSRTHVLTPAQVTGRGGKVTRRPATQTAKRGRIHVKYLPKPGPREKKKRSR